MIRPESSVHPHWVVAQRWLVRALISGVAAWYAWHVLVHGGDSQTFAVFLPLAPDAPYPTGSVVLTIFAMAVEVVLVDLLLNYRAPRELWRRSLIGGLALGPVSVFAFKTLMDAPPYHGIHLLWLVCLNIILVGLAALSGFAHLMRAVTLPRR